MKRIISFFLIMFLLIPVLTLAENLSPPFINHEIWSIPWGTPLEEFLPLAHEKIGILFVPTSIEGFNGEIKYQVDSSQSISILGYSTRYIEVSFLKDTKHFAKIFVAFDYEEIMPDSSYTLPMYLNLWNQLSALYGTPTDLSVVPFTLTPTGNEILPEFPIKDDQFDMEQYWEILERFLNVEFVLNARFDNIMLSHIVSQRGETPYYFIGLIAEYIDGDAGYYPPELSNDFVPITPATIHLGF